MSTCSRAEERHTGTKNKRSTEETVTSSIAASILHRTHRRTLERTTRSTAFRYEATNGTKKNITLAPFTHTHKSRRQKFFRERFVGLGKGTKIESCGVPFDVCNLGREKERF